MLASGGLSGKKLIQILEFMSSSYPVSIADDVIVPSHGCYK